MKILYIIHSCIMGGATISFCNLIRGCKENGIDITVVCPYEKNAGVEFLSFLDRLGCRYIFAHIPSSYISLISINDKIKFPLRSLRLIIYKTRFYLELKRIAVIENPDIIHTNTGVVHEGAIVARKKGIPHIWHLREYQLKDFNMHPFPSMATFKRLTKNSFTVCITKDIQKYFGLENYVCSSVIYNPIMPESIVMDKSSVQIREPYFLCANRISCEKGIEDIISAFSQFIRFKPYYKLKIYGFGSESYVNYLKGLCAENNMTDCVEFLGYADTNIIYASMKSSKALIVGSYNEGFGRMTAEANMLGVPVIGRNTAGTKEILDQTYGGFRFSTVEELVRKMKVVAEMNAIQICEFMKEPERRAKELFSTESHVKRMMQLYDKVTGGGYSCRVVCQNSWFSSLAAA